MRSMKAKENKTKLWFILTLLSYIKTSNHTIYTSKQAKILTLFISGS